MAGPRSTHARRKAAPQPEGTPEPEPQQLAGPVYAKVVAHVQRLINDGTLKPGDKLPSERELAQHFQLGRSSVRDAIRTLEVRGVVRPRQGEGTVVRDLSTEAVTAPLSSMLLRKRALVKELMEVRFMIEPPLAARAAVRATERQIARMEEILDRQRLKTEEGELTVQEDFDFHFTLWTMAGNSVVLNVLDVLMDLLAESRARGLQVRGRQTKSIEGHRVILSAIRHHDPKSAESAMRRHIVAVKDVILRRM
jgi:GntR family transcriptional regulator, transcriptional repressor for pyruvate dehydrogenase complex